MTTAPSLSNPQPPAEGTLSLTVTPSLHERKRLTVAFRPILGIPHEILVGSFHVGASGALGAVAAACAFISWFAILFTGGQPKGLWDLEYFYFRWRVRALTYLSLLRDEYPPFGEGEYAAAVAIARPAEPRPRLSVGFRPILVIPQILIAGLLVMAWMVTTVIAWFVILFTGNYPAGLANFGVGVMRWVIRVEAYFLLLSDEYPPFSLNS